MNKMFGTNGIRGLINEELTVDLVLNLGRAIGSVLGPGQIALARDSRMGGEMFSRAMMAGLLSTLYRSFAEGPTQEEADRLCKIGVDMINKAIKKTSTTDTTHYKVNYPQNEMIGPFGPVC